MKTHRASLLVLLAALNTALVHPLTAAPASATPATSYPVGAVERYGTVVIRPGDSATKVAAYLGSPDQKLSSDTWIYRRFQSQRAPAHAADCTTLLISFNQGRVSDLKKINEPAVTMIAAQLSPPVATHQVVAGK